MPRQYRQVKCAYNANTTKCRTCPKHCQQCDDIYDYEARHKIDHAAHTAKETLCWCCKYAVPDPYREMNCPWITRGIPVNHWDATVRVLEGEIAYNVKDCPMFERGGRFDREIEEERQNGTGENDNSRTPY